VKTLIVLAFVAGAGYYAYKAVWDEPKTCASTETACMQKCRRTTTENAAAQACQADCTSERESCDREKARASR
jgi:hypothetical protein